MYIKHLGAICITLILLICVFSAQAEIPQNINYQGSLTDSAGDPVEDNSYLIKFIIYGSESGSDELWNSGFQVVPVSGGVFSYLLGANVPLPSDLFEGDSTRYLGITVGTDPEGIPRTKLTSSAYAFHSALADNLQVPADLIGNEPALPTLLVRNNAGGDAVRGISTGGYAGVFEGDVLVTEDLTVSGKINATGLGDITAVTTGSGLEGGASSGTANIYIPDQGVTGDHIENETIYNKDINPDAAIAPSKIADTAAVIGAINHFTSLNYFEDDVITDGGDFAIRNNIRHRWRLHDDETSGLQFNQVYNHSNTLLNETRFELFDDGRVGVGGSDSSCKMLVADSSSRNISFNSALKVDYQYSGTQITNGIYSKLVYLTTGDDASAIRGVVSSNTGNRAALMAVGQTLDFNIETGTTYGLYASAYDGYTSYGVYAYGQSAVNNWAGYFGGNVRVTGSIDDSKHSLRIDHPLDPENRILEHSGINSPEMLNVYSGNVITNKDGEVVG